MLHLQYSGSLNTQHIGIPNVLQFNGPKTRWPLFCSRTMENKLAFLIYKMVEATQKLCFPIVRTIGKPNKMAAILSTIKNQILLENRTDSYHLNSERAWYSSPHCSAIWESITNKPNIFLKIGGHENITSQP